MSEDIQTRIRPALDYALSGIVPQDGRGGLSLLLSDRGTQREYAVRLAARLLELRPVDTARGVYHARDARGHRYYIKYRTVQPHETAPFFMFMPRLHSGFDHLAGLIFARDTFDLLGLVRTPHGAVQDLVRHYDNADLLTWRFIREDPRIEKLCLCTDDRLGRQYKLRWSPRQ